MYGFILGDTDSRRFARDRFDEALSECAAYCYTSYVGILADGSSHLIAIHGRVYCMCGRGKLGLTKAHLLLWKDVCTQRYHFSEPCFAGNCSIVYLNINGLRARRQETLHMPGKFAVCTLQSLRP